MPKMETFTSRFEETRGGRVPQKSIIWRDVVYGWSHRKTTVVLVNLMHFIFHYPRKVQIQLQMIKLVF